MEWIAAGLGLLDTAFGIFGSNKQKKVDDQQVNLQFKDNLEEIRRREFEQQTTKGAAKAMSEASGVLHSGGSSAQVYLDLMASEFDKEISWMKEYANEAKRIGHKSASVRRETNVMNAFSSGLSTGTGIYGALR